VTEITSRTHRSQQVTRQLDQAVHRWHGQIVLIEQYDEWLVGRRCLSDESIRLVLNATMDQETHPDQDSGEGDRAQRALAGFS
jgi:hypothetical protein